MRYSNWFMTRIVELILVEWFSLTRALEIEPEGAGLDFDNELVE